MAGEAGEALWQRTTDKFRTCSTLLWCGRKRAEAPTVNRLAVFNLDLPDIVDTAGTDHFEVSLRVVILS